MGLHIVNPRRLGIFNPPPPNKRVLGVTTHVTLKIVLISKLPASLPVYIVVLHVYSVVFSVFITTQLRRRFLV